MLPVAVPPPRFEHLTALTHPLGMWEHAEGTRPRVAHGFCTDDNARALIVVSREPAGPLNDLAAIYLRFVLDAQTRDGRFHNRRDHDGTWIDDIGSDDSQGRAWWALGVAARHGPQLWMRRAGLLAFDACGSFESVHLRANAYAILGAVEVLAVEPDHAGARDLLRRGIERLAAAAGSRIPWLEPRLTYDNARLPEAFLAAGAAVRNPNLIRTGLRLLTWLCEVETSDGHFSFTPAGGWTPEEERPGFDQQPIEAGAMAEACHRAWTITGDGVWRVRALRAAGWFVGLNDTRGTLYDEATGGTRDGLMRHGVNENQGAESTLAGLTAIRIAEELDADEPDMTIT
jgi:hypothetical protein